jgi:hypothetical protein
MEFFTKYYPHAKALELDPANPSTYCADFIGWDTAEQGTASESATRVGDVGQRMSATDAARFQTLGNDSRVTIDGIVYSRNG